MRFVNDRGVVVGVVSTGSFAPPLKAESYADLTNGIFVQTDRGALILFSDDDHLADMRFVLERRRDF